MTPQEQQMLQGLTDRVNQTQLPDKDPEAEQFLTQSLGRNPDAIYILAQTVLVQQYALDQAKQQIAQMQQAPAAPAQPQKHTSFLGNLLGMNDEPAPPPPPPQQQYQPVQTYAQPSQSYAQPVSYGAPQGGGFLRSAMQTAAGVAAGAFAFEGIESLMHGFGEHAGYGSGFGSFGGGQNRPEEIVNNNYYGDDTLQGQAEHEGRSPDVEDRRNDSIQDNYADTSDDSSSYDNSGGDSGSDNFDPDGNDTSF